MGVSCRCWLAALTWLTNVLWIGRPLAYLGRIVGSPAGPQHRIGAHRSGHRLVCPASANLARDDGTPSGTLATMGCADPYSIAAKFAQPEPSPRQLRYSISAQPGR